MPRAARPPGWWSRLTDLPRHFESVLLDKLAVKLREEYGSPAPAAPRSRPPRRRPRAAASPAPDAAALPRAPTGELPRPERR